MGEQSVRAMMPKLRLVTSGALLTVCAPAQPAGKPEARIPSAVALVEAERNVRRERLFSISMILVRGRFGSRYSGTDAKQPEALAMSGMIFHPVHEISSCRRHILSGGMVDIFTIKP